MDKKIADLIAETLEELDITHIFGIIGAGNVHIFEAIAKRGFSEIICVHHEQAATMAMQTYYRVSGKLAAVLLTTGAGSTNGVTGVVSAWADSIPGLVIAGNENSKYTFSSDIRMWGVQGYDSVSMIDKVSKYAIRVTDPKNVKYELMKAVDISLNSRPGPVWVEIPMDVQSSFIDCDLNLPVYHKYDMSINSPYIDEQIKTIKLSLRNSKRPVLWVGHGVRLSGNHAKLEKLSKKLKIPILVSWAGVDMIDSANEYVFGRAGVYGQRCANFILQNSDYVLTIGTRLALPQIGYNLSELAREAIIDVVDIDPVEANKHKPRIRESIVCDAGKVISELMELDLEERITWLSYCNKLKETYPWVDAKDHSDKDGFINSYKFIEKLNDTFKPDQLIVTDMGTALLCAHQVLKLKPGQRLMTSTGLGEMGFGLPGAIGASIASNFGEVICLNCDGGMMLNLQELQTIIHHNLPIKIFVFNNDGYLMIKHTQTALFKSNRIGVNKSNGVSCPDYVKVGQAFGFTCFTISSWEDFDIIIPKIKKETGPVLCEVMMHPNQLFSPKLGMSMRNDGVLVSSPLEDLSPLLPRESFYSSMLIDIHEKSK